MLLKGLVGPYPQQAKEDLGSINWGGSVPGSPLLREQVSNKEGFLEYMAGRGKGGLGIAC